MPMMEDEHGTYIMNSKDLRAVEHVEQLVNRGYTDGFYELHHTHEQQNYMHGHSENFRQQYVGDIIACANGIAEIDVKNKFQVGDKLEIIHPFGNQIVVLNEMRSLKGEALTNAPGNGHRVQIPLQGELSKGMVARFL